MVYRGEDRLPGDAGLGLRSSDSCNRQDYDSNPSAVNASRHVEDVSTLILLIAEPWSPWFTEIVRFQLVSLVTREQGKFRIIIVERRSPNLTVYFIVFLESQRVADNRGDFTKKLSRIPQSFG